MGQTFWLREETKSNEFRRALVPKDCLTLISKGHHVVVEDWNDSIIPTESYQAVGCEIVSAGSWTQAPSEAIIIGLKHLPETVTSYRHRHIYFAHVYKEQDGWREVLAKFQSGGGAILDLEFMTDDFGRRVCAFGYWAGFVGAALGALVCNLKDQSTAMDELAQKKYFENKDLLLNFIKQNTTMKSQESIVIGSMGRSGHGAVDCLKSLGWQVTGWDKLDTNVGGPFREILNYDLFVNCVLAMGDIPPFITQEILADNQNLKVISDVSCDPDSDCNMIPLYQTATTLDLPFHLIKNAKEDIKLIAIDNLPSVLPYESSVDFSSQLTPYLVEFDMKGIVMNNTLEWFTHTMSKI